MLGAELARHGLVSLTLDGKVSNPGTRQVLVTLSCVCADCRQGAELLHASPVWGLALL